jgi:hypothetical protein
MYEMQRGGTYETEPQKNEIGDNTSHAEPTKTVFWILQAPVTYPTILLTINYSVSLSKGTNVTSNIVCTLCSIIHLLF